MPRWMPQPARRTTAPSESASRAPPTVPPHPTPPGRCVRHGQQSGTDAAGRSARIAARAPTPALGGHSDPIRRTEPLGTPAEYVSAITLTSNRRPTPGQPQSRWRRRASRRQAPTTVRSDPTMRPTRPTLPMTNPASSGMFDSSASSWPDSLAGELYPPLVLSVPSFEEPHDRTRERVWSPHEPSE